MTENIKVYTQNSIRIETEAGVVYIDPFKMTEAPHDASFILITHEHYDHFSPESIEKVGNRNTLLVVPEKMVKKAGEALDYVGEVETVTPGEFKNLNGLEFETVASYNVLKPFHPKSAGWVGYIIKTGGKRIYIAGDTDDTKEAKNVDCDVALVPIGGFYTMDAAVAAKLINTIKPEVAIPVHYGEVVGSPQDGEVFAKGVKAPTRVEFKIRF